MLSPLVTIPALRTLLRKRSRSAVQPDLGKALLLKTVIEYGLCEIPTLSGFVACIAGAHWLFLAAGIVITYIGYALCFPRWAEWERRASEYDAGGPANTLDRAQMMQDLVPRSDSIDDIRQQVRRSPRSYLVLGIISGVAFGASFAWMRLPWEVWLIYSPEIAFFALGVPWVSALVANRTGVASEFSVDGEGVTALLETGRVHISVGDIVKCHPVKWNLYTIKPQRWNAAVRVVTKRGHDKRLVVLIGEDARTIMKQARKHGINVAGPV